MIGISVSDILKALDQLPLWKAVSGLPKRVKELEERVAALEAKPPAKPAEACPLCEAPMRIAQSIPHRSSALMRKTGVLERRLECTNDECRHAEWRVFDPNGRLGPKG